MKRNLSETLSIPRQQRNAIALTWDDMRLILFVVCAKPFKLTIPTQWSKRAALCARSGLPGRALTSDINSTIGLKEFVLLLSSGTRFVAKTTFPAGNIAARFNRASLIKYQQLRKHPGVSLADADHRQLIVRLRLKLAALNALLSMSDARKEIPVLLRRLFAVQPFLQIGYVSPMVAAVPDPKRARLVAAALAPASASAAAAAAAATATAAAAATATATATAATASKGGASRSSRPRRMSPVSVMMVESPAPPKRVYILDRASGRSAAVVLDDADTMEDLKQRVAESFEFPRIDSFSLRLAPHSLSPFLRNSGNGLIISDIKAVREGDGLVVFASSSSSSSSSSLSSSSSSSSSASASGQSALGPVVTVESLMLRFKRLQTTTSVGTDIATTVAAIASEETGVEPWIRMVATRTEEQRLFASSIISVLDELRSSGS